MEDIAAAPTTTGFHQLWLVSMPTPPATRLIAATINKILAKFLAAPSPKKPENAHDPSGQTIPGFSSKRRELCPKYNK